jgi:chromosome segregation ATPase
MLEKLESNLLSLEKDVKTSQGRVKDLENQIKESKARLENENKQVGSNKSEEKHSLLALLEKVKQQKNLCNRARAKVSPLEQQMVDVERIFQELAKEVYEGQKNIEENLEVFNCLKENLATAQDLNESLLNRFKQKTDQAAHCEDGFQVKSVKDLKKLKKVKVSQMDEMVKRKKELVEEIERIEREIAVYTKHKSCRHSGIFQ